MKRTGYKTIPQYGIYGPTQQMKHGIDMRKLWIGEGAEVEFSTDEMTTDFGNLLLEDNYFDTPDMVKCASVFEDLAGESGDDADDEYVPTFEKLRRRMTDVVAGGDVKKIILSEGVGEVVPAGFSVRVHYHAFLEDMTEPFDSSYLRGRQLRITLGRGDVIPGLDLAIATMRKSEKSRFLIAPSFGYGASGCPPRIPPDSSILFEVELLSFSECVDNFDDEARNGLSLKRGLVIAKSIKSEGNEHFGQGNYYKAQKCFLRCINVLETVRLKDEEEEIEMMKTVGKAYQNMGLCALKLGNFGKALDAARRVLEYDPKNAKALFIAGKALRHIGDFSYARKYLLRAKQLVPSSGDVAKELKLIDKNQEKFREAEVDMCRKMFGGNGKRSHYASSSAAKPVRANDIGTSVSLSFRNIIEQKLKEYDTSCTGCELIIPIATFTKSEILSTVDIADEMGFDAELVEKPGKAKCIKVMRR